MATFLLHVLFLTWVVTLTLPSSSYATPRRHPRQQRGHAASLRKALMSQARPTEAMMSQANPTVAMTSQTGDVQGAEVVSGSGSPGRGGYSPSGATSRAAGERRMDGDLETKDSSAPCLGKDCAAQTEAAPSLSIQISTKVTRRKTASPQLQHENSAYRQRLHEYPYDHQRGDSNKHQANTNPKQPNSPVYSKLQDVAKNADKTDHNALIITETTPKLDPKEAEIDTISKSIKNKDSRINLFASLPRRRQISAKGEQNKATQEKHYSETLRKISERQQKSGTNNFTLRAALTPNGIRHSRVGDEHRHHAATDRIKNQKKRRQGNKRRQTQFDEAIEKRHRTIGGGEKRHEKDKEKAAEKHRLLSTKEAEKRHDTGWRETERLHKERAGDGGSSDGSDVAARDRASFSDSEPFKVRTAGLSRYGVFSDRKGTRGSGQSSADDFPHRPAAADRLEKRILPSLRDAGSRLVGSLRDAHNMLLDGLQPVMVSNTFVFNSTRYTIMLGVREQLQEIAKANNMVYETVLRASLLTRNIYLRAQQHSEPKTDLLPGPQTRRADFSDVIGAANKTKELAEQVLKTLQDRKSERERLDLKLRQIREKFHKEFGLSSIRALFYYINSTVNQLGSELAVSARTAYLRRNRAVLTSSASQVQKARQLLYNASNHIMDSTKNYRGSYAVTQEWKHRRKADGQVGPPVPFRRQHDGQTIAKTTQVLQTIKRLKDHGTEQESLSLKIERILRPSIIVGQKVVEQSDVETTALLLGLSSRLTEDGKNLYSVLEAIRLLIGADQALVWAPGPSPRRCPDDDLVEGSACEDTEEEGMEGSATAEPPSTTTSDDEDFIFVDKLEPDVRMLKPTSLEEFGDKLSVFVDGVILRSNNILQQGDQLQSRIKPLSERWSQAKSNFQAAEQVLEVWHSTEASLRNFTALADTVHARVVEIDNRVTKSKESIDKKMAHVKEIAERKLAEVASSTGNGESSSGESNDQPSSDDTAILLQAEDKVKAVESERDAIRSLRTLTPGLCNLASGHLQTIQANISLLQQQVHTARQLLHSMQLSLSKSSDGYLSIPLSLTTAGSSSKRFLPSQSSPLSLVMTLQLCIRTQGKTEGTVLVVKGNKSDFFSLSVDDQQLSVIVYSSDGWKLDTVSSAVSMQNNTWYSVNITRTGKAVVLTVKLRAGSEDAVKNDVIVDKMAYLQPDPVHIYVGGIASNEPFSKESKDTWRGCLGDLHVNGHAVSLLHTSSTGAAPQLCQDQCTMSVDGGSLVFDGTGFLHFPESVIPLSSPVQKVSFLFRTLQDSAAILQIYNKRQRFLLHVVLSDGGVLINSTTPRESKILHSQESSFNDGKFHSLKIQYQDNRITPEIDGKGGVFTTERSRPVDMNSMIEGVIVGAFVNGSYAFETTKYRPLMGCVQKLEIADKPLYLPLAAASYGAYTGSCNTQSMWSQCVQFGPSSVGFDLGNFNHSSTILLHFSPSARGPLLTYSRPDKFEAEIRATAKGLEISIAGENLEIYRPDDAAESFDMMIVTDDGKKVKVEAWKNTVSHSYGGFWDASAPLHGEHNIQLALPPQDNTDQKLKGQITQLVIGHRLIDLSSYINLLKLSSCERLLPDLEMVHPAGESTSTPTLEKCSTDIKCKMA